MTSLPDGLLRAIDTPCVLIDLECVERNLLATQSKLAQAGLVARPHIKTHKIPAFARRQLELGAVGITCQKISEAEVFADAGCDDILIPYNILGDVKLARLHALSRKVKLSVCADSLVTVDGLARWFEDPGKRLDVLVECDTGQHRCGVTSPAAALVLARAINDRPGLRFAELLTYPPRGKAEAVNVWLKEARDLCTAAGLPPQVISNGGTPGLNELGELDCVTEYRAGSYIYNDRSLVAKGSGRLERLRPQGGRHGGEPAERHARDHRCRLEDLDVGPDGSRWLRPLYGVSGRGFARPERRARLSRPLES